MGLTPLATELGVDADCDPEQVAEVLVPLASPWHLEIVRLLADGELDVTEIATHLELSVANTSHHLGRPRRAGLVTSQRDRTRITNRLTGPAVLDLCHASCQTASAPRSTNTRSRATRPPAPGAGAGT